MKRIFALSCDVKFFIHAQNLLTSIKRSMVPLIDKVLFFDLGLLPEQRATLIAENVKVIDYPQALIEETYPDFLTPRMFAWKTYILQIAASYGDLILYTDCGCVALNSIAPIYESIAAHDIFFIQDIHRNDQRTHETCFRIMNATNAERAALQIDAGVIGYRSAGRFAHIFPEAFEFARNRNCIFGDATTHRHDQSIYSILAARYNVPNPHPYGTFLHWKGIESTDQILWQHRGKWPYFQRLAARAAAQPESRIAIYGTGQHTERFLNTFRVLTQPRHQIVGFLDDSPRSSAYAALPLLPTASYPALRPDVILISSDAHEHILYSKIRDIAPKCQIWRIYN